MKIIYHIETRYPARVHITLPGCYASSAALLLIGVPSLASFAGIVGDCSFHHQFQENLQPIVYARNNNRLKSTQVLTQSTTKWIVVLQLTS